MAVANVVAKFEADISDVQAKMTALKRSFSDVTNQTNSLSSRLKTVGEDMSVVGRKMSVGITLPLAAVGAAAVKTSMDFETSMAKIEGLVGVASDEVAAMGEQILETSAQFGTGANESAEALFFITSAGLRGADAMNVLEASMKASQVGLGDVATVADLATSAMNAYGPEVLSATDATDVLTTAVREGKLEAEELAGSMGRVLPIASAMGVNFDEVGAAMAAMSRTGTNAAEASTQLRGILSSILRPTVQAEEALAGMGLSAEGLRSQIKEEGLLATLQTLSEEFAGNDAAAAQVFGNVRALAGVMDLMGANAETTASIFDSLTRATGATDAAFDVASQTAEFRMNQALAEMKTALIEVGDAIMPVATTMIDFAKTALQAFNSLPGPIKTIVVAFGGIAAALGPVLWIGGKVMTMLGVMGAAWVRLRGRVTSTIGTMTTSIRTFEVNVKTAMIGARTQMGALAAAARVMGATVANAFRTIGAAIKGMMASLGPVGLAIIGVSIAYEVLSGRSADAEARVQALTDALSQQGEAAERAAAEVVAGALLANEWGRFWFIENNVQDFEDLATAADMNMAEIVAAVMAGGAEMEAVIKSFRDAGEEGVIDPLRAGEAIAAIQAQRDAYVEATRNVEIAAEAAEVANATSGTSAREMAGEYRRAARDMTDSQASLRDAFNAGIRAVEGLEQAYMNLTDAMSDEASVDNAYRAINRLNDELKEGDKSIKGYSDAALDNRQAIRDAAQAWMDYAAATDDPEEAQKRLAQGQREIRDALKEAGIDPKDSDIFQTLKAQQQQSKETVDEFAKQRDKAAQYGNDVGNNFIDGIVQELARRKAEVAAAAAAVGDAMNTGAAAATESQSPSRTAMRIAGDFTDGAVIGLRKGSGKVNAEARRIGNALNAAFVTALRDGGGSIASAINEVFGSIPTQSPLESLLGEEGAEKFIENNTKALQSLAALGSALDVISDKFGTAKESIQGLADLLARPLGRTSDLFRAFAQDQDIDSVINGFLSLRDGLRSAYSLLTDVSVVGAKAARENRQALRDTIGQLRELTKEAIALREEYAANEQAISDLDESYRSTVEGINKRYEEMIPGLESALKSANETYERENKVLTDLIKERDSFLSKIASGFRSFMNNFSKDARKAATETITETRRIADGISIELSREVEIPGTATFAAALRERLDAIRDFATNIRRLTELGLDERLIQEFVDAGVSGAGEAVKELASSSVAQISEINSLQKDLESETTGFQDWAAGRWHEYGIAQQQAITDSAKAAADAAKTALDNAKADQQAELKAAEDAYKAQREALEARNRDLQVEMDRVAREIESIVRGVLKRLPEETTAAAQTAIAQLIAGFEREFPEAAKRLGALMDQLSKSLARTIRLDIKLPKVTRGGESRAAKAIADESQAAVEGATAGANVLALDAMNGTATLVEAWREGLSNLPGVIESALQGAIVTALSQGAVLMQVFADLAGGIYQSFGQISEALQRFWFRLMKSLNDSVMEWGTRMVKNLYQAYVAWFRLMQAMGAIGPNEKPAPMPPLNFDAGPSQPSIISPPKMEFGVVPVGMFAANKGAGGVNVQPNAVNITVNVTGEDADTVRRQVEQAVNDGLENLAREIVAA